MTTQQKIDILINKVRPTIVSMSFKGGMYFFCTDSLGLLDYENFEEFKILEALEMCGGEKPDELSNGSFNPKEHVNAETYSEWKLQILDKAVELLKAEL